MTDDELNELLRTVVEPTLIAAGFESGQGDWTGVTYRFDQDRFTDRFPWLPQASPADWQRGGSTDLTIEFDQITGLLGRLDLEGMSLASTAYRVGRGELAANLKAAMALPLVQSLPIVAEALDAILTEPSSPAP